MKDWIKEYLDLGWSLCALRPGQKGPYQHRWGHINLDESHWAANPEDGVGLILGRSGVATIDVDDLECAKVALRALGIDLEALLGVPDAVQIVSREGRAKLAYKIPESIRDIVSQKRAINWKAEDGSSFCVLEFRAGSTQLQDVLPPSIHPATGRPYEWRGNFRRMPDLPAALAAVWAQWEIARQKMMDADPNRSSHHKASERKQIDYKSHNGSNASVIDTFNRAFTVWDVMSRPSLRGHYEEKGNRWRRIGSTETPGVVALESLSAPGQHVLYSHHAGDDLMADKQYTYTAFSLYCLAEHGGDCGLAVAAAAQELGLPPLDPLVRSAAVGEDQVHALVASGGGVREMRADKSDSASDDDESFGELIELPPFTIPEEPDPDPGALVEMPGCLEGRVLPVPAAQVLADWIAGRVGKAKVAATVQTTLAIICHLAGRRYVSDETGTAPGVLFGVLDSATVNLAPYLRCADDVLDGLGSYETGKVKGQLPYIMEKSGNDISTSSGLVDHYRGAARLFWGSTSIATMLERESRQINPTFQTLLDKLGEVRHGASMHYSPAKGDTYSVRAPAVTSLWALTPHSVGGLVRTTTRSGLMQQTLVADALAESAIWRTGRQDLPEAVTSALRAVTSRAAKEGHVYPMDDFQEYEPLRVPVGADARQAFEQLAAEIRTSCGAGDKLREYPLRGAARGWTEAAESIALGLAALRDPTAPRIDLGLAEWACAWVLDCWRLLRERVGRASEDTADVERAILERLRAAGRDGATLSDLKGSLRSLRGLPAKRRTEILDGLEADGQVLSARKTSGKRYFLRKTMT